MKSSVRFVAALLLALLLPVQAAAAACAQICASLDSAHPALERAAHAGHGGPDHGEPHPGSAQPAHDHGPLPHDHCDGMGAGGCCQGHVFVVEIAPAMPADPMPSFERHCFVARWTNFIPEEPSPPPIVSFRA